MLLLHSLLLPLPLAAAATNLYVAGRSLITSLSFSPTSLTASSTHNGCADDPSWLIWDSPNRLLYCLDDDTRNNGSISSYSAAANGKLTLLNRVNTPVGPVSGVLYGPNSSRGLLVANYHSQSIATYLAPPTPAGNLTRLQTFTFSEPPGPSPRQNAPHPHQAATDPTGQYIFVPDLGSDLIRIFSFAAVDKLIEHPSISTPPGSGPRHLTFWQPDGEEPGGQTFLILLSELANMVSTWLVDYGTVPPTVIRVFEISSLGDTEEPRAGTMAAEVLVTPDNRFIVASNRNDRSAAGGQDSLVTFEALPGGGLIYHSTAAAGGNGPRHFSFNKAGDRVAVGLQGSNKVVVLERDVESGEIGKVLVERAVQGAPACVLWDEDE